MFEFKTKEERAAWDVIERLSNSSPLLKVGWVETSVQLAEAADRFDEREKLCGIEPNSFDHGLLMIAQYSPLNSFYLSKPTIRKYLGNNRRLNDLGKELLANLNRELCK